MTEKLPFWILYIGIPFLSLQAGGSDSFRLLLAARVAEIVPGSKHAQNSIGAQGRLSYRNPYIKGPKRQFFLNFFTIFWAAREAALAADWITAWKTLPASLELGIPKEKVKF